MLFHLPLTTYHLSLMSTSPPRRRGWGFFSLARTKILHGRRHRCRCARISTYRRGTRCCCTTAIWTTQVLNSYRTRRNDGRLRPTLWKIGITALDGSAASWSCTVAGRRGRRSHRSTAHIDRRTSRITNRSAAAIRRARRRAIAGTRTCVGLCR